MICVMGLKLLRSAFSDSSRQHIVLLWTVLFFHFDYVQSSETFVVDYFFLSIFMSKASRSNAVLVNVDHHTLSVRQRHHRGEHVT